MQFTLALMGVLGLIGVGWFLSRQPLDLGDVPNWDDQRAARASEDTERWFGRSWETARLCEPWALTTKELDRVADEAIRQEREERLREMQRGRFGKRTA